MFFDSSNTSHPSSPNPSSPPNPSSSPNARENFFATIKSAGVFAGLTTVSRVGGLARDLLFAFLLGGSIYADLFWVAFRLPNLFRKIVAEGAMDAAFVPRYQRSLSSACVYSSLRLILNVLYFMVPWVGGVSVVIMVTMPMLAYVLAPGIIDADPYHNTVVILMRIMFPYLLCMVVVSIFSGAANSHGHFGFGAACPIVLNVSMVTVLSVVALHTNSQETLISPERIVMFLSVAVFLAGILQVVWMMMAWWWWVWPQLSKRSAIASFSSSSSSPTGVLLRPSPRKKNSGYALWLFHVGIRAQRLWRISPCIRSMLKTLGVTVLVGGLFQINLMIDQIIASTVGVGAISHIFFADRLVQLPLALIGISAGNVMLAKVAGLVAQRSTTKHQDCHGEHGEHGEHPDNRKSLDTVNGIMLLVWSLVIPSTIGLALFAHPLVTALYQRGAFTAVDTTATAQILTMLALGLPAFSLIKPLSALVYAHQAARILVPMAAISIPINVVWSLILKEPLGAAGIALATSMTSWFYLIVVAFLVIRRGWWSGDVWRQKNGKLLLFSCVLVALLVLMVAWAVLHSIRSIFLPQLFASPWFFAVLIPILLGAMMAYVAWWWWWLLPRMITIIASMGATTATPK